MQDGQPKSGRVSNTWYHVKLSFTYRPKWPTITVQSGSFDRRDLERIQELTSNKRITYDALLSPSNWFGFTTVENRSKWKLVFLISSDNHVIKSTLRANRPFSELPFALVSKRVFVSSAFIWKCVPPIRSFLCKSKSFSYERFCLRTHFETGNSELAYLQGLYWQFLLLVIDTS